MNAIDPPEASDTDGPPTKIERAEVQRVLSSPAENIEKCGDLPPECSVLASPIAPQMDPDASSAYVEPADTLPAGTPPPAILPLVEVDDFDWPSVRNAVDPPAIRARMRSTVERMEILLDAPAGIGMLFDNDRANGSDYAIRVSEENVREPVWIIGDLHGDFLALEAALALVRNHASENGTDRARIIFLGDLFDDGGFGLEVLLRVFELIVEAPELVCVVAGNHDEALSYDGIRFTSSVEPSDFTDFLNANLAHEWIERAGKLTVRLFARTPRALFFPDGLFIAHGGFPLVDLHQRLSETGNWNDPPCLADFVWTRAHPKARKKIPNRFSRGSQFGYEDFATFCSLSVKLGRPVTHMVRGHDHVEERYAIYPAYVAHPILTTVALSRRLNRENLGSYERAPTLARFVKGALPQVYRLNIPANMIRDVYPQADLPAELPEDHQHE